MTIERIERDGKVFAVIPIEEFEAIAEDAEMLADIQAFDDATDRDEEAFPIEFGESLAEAYHAGNSLIPVWRKYRNMTQSELANKAGIKQPYLSDIESGKKPGSIEAIKAIATALDVMIDDIV